MYTKWIFSAAADGTGTNWRTLFLQVSTFLEICLNAFYTIYVTSKWIITIVQ